MGNIWKKQEVNNLKSLYEFVRTCKLTDSCNKFKLTYNIYDRDNNVLNTWSKDVRLGITVSKDVIVMCKGSSRRGHYLEYFDECRYSREYRDNEKSHNYELVEVKWLKPTPRKSEQQKFVDKCNKILGYLQKYNLWGKVQNGIKIFRAFPLDELKHIKDTATNVMYKCNAEPTELDKLMQENNEIYYRYALFVRASGDESLMDFFEKAVVENKIVIDEEPLRKIFGIIANSDKFDYLLANYRGKVIYPVWNLLNDLSMIRYNPIKKMCFHKGKWNKSKTEHELQTIKEYMANKKSYHTSGYNSYDVSFEYNAEKQMAWYSEEYRGCGNGHYYIALDDEHALFCEDD